MADDAAAKGAEDCVVPGEMPGHAAHRGSLNAALRLRRADGRASRPDGGGESRRAQHCTHNGSLSQKLPSYALVNTKRTETAPHHISRARG
jgi:hypothetical protein